MPGMPVGVNYPWRRYGGDFGPTVWQTHHGIRADRDDIARDFAAMAGLGIEVVRWFVFTDARGGIALDPLGWPSGFRDGTLDDLDALFALALEAGLSVVPVLFDHTLVFAPTDAGGARVGGHYAWLADPEGQARLLDTVIAPLARRYGARGSHGHLGAAVHAWDLLNEPDWIIAEHHPSRRVPAPIPFDVLAAWVRGAIATLRAHDAGAVTIGNARLRFAGWWDDPAFGFDFLQAHAYYDRASRLRSAADAARGARAHAAAGRGGVLGAGRCRRRRRRTPGALSRAIWRRPPRRSASPARGRGAGAASTRTARSRTTRCGRSGRRTTRGRRPERAAAASATAGAAVSAPARRPRSAAARRRPDTARARGTDPPPAR